MDLNNPAELLRYWTSQAFHTPGPANGDLRAIDAWRQAWQLEDDLAGNRELVARAWALTETTAEVRTRAEALPTGSILLQPYHEIEEAIANFVNMETITRGTFFSPVKQTGWLCLNQLNEFLAVDGHTPVGQQGEVEDLVDQTRRLQDDVRDDDQLPADLKRQVVEQLQEVITLLLRAEIGGGPELSRALNGVGGVMLRIGLAGREFLDHPLVETIWRIGGGIAALVGMGADWHALEAGGISMLALPPGKDSSGGSGGGGSN